MGRKIIIAHFPTDTLKMDDSMIESEFNELLNPQKIIGYHNLVQLQKISGDPNFSYLMRIPSSYHFGHRLLSCPDITVLSIMMFPRRNRC